jgi:hypothetical protein
MFVDLERVSIIAVQPILGADPQIAAAVLEDLQPGVLGQTILNGQVLKPDDTAGCKVECRVTGWSFRGGGKTGGKRQNEQDKDGRKDDGQDAFHIEEPV